MRSRYFHLFLGIIVIISLSFSSFAATTESQSQYLVASGGNNAGGQSVQADEFTGAATYSITFPVPPARGSIQPTLNLNYNSYRKNPNSWVGYGWELSFGSIERLPEEGIIDFSEGTKFEARFGGQAEELTLEEAGVNPANYGVTVAPGTTANRYRAQVESAFNIYLHLRSPSGSELGWVVIDKGGTRYEFGTTDYSREGTTEVLRWFLNEVTDPNGNVLTINYSGARQPETATYQDITLTFVIDNIYAEGVKHFPTFREGFLGEAALANRLNYILVESAAQGRLQKYDFGYTSAENGYEQLALIRQYGTTDSVSLPPTIFDYYDQSSLSWSTINYDYQASREVGDNYSNGVTGNYTQLIDMNGDGLPDQVTTFDDNNEIHIYLNDGNDFSTHLTWTEPFDTTCLYGPGCTGRLYSFENNSNRQWLFLIDMNGDALPDRVMSKIVPNTVNRQAEFWIAFNTGNGWATDSAGDPEISVWPDPFVGIAPGSQDNNKWFMDMNGDGLVDRVVHASEQEGYSGDDGYLVFYNTGSGFNTNYTFWSDPLSLTEPDHNGIGTSAYAGPHGTEGFLRDMNGDGLPDRVRRSTLYINESPVGTGWVYHINRNGTHWVSGSTDPSDPNNTLEGIDGINQIGILDPYQEEDTAGYINYKRDWIDMNGDGYLDLVHGDLDANHFEVYFYQGASVGNFSILSDPIILEDPVSENRRGEIWNVYANNGNIFITDMNGDGYPDRVQIMPESVGTDTHYEIFPMRVNAMEFSTTPSGLNDPLVNQPVGALKGIDDGQGNETTIEYLPSTQPNLTASNPLVPNHRFLPFNLYLAHKIYTRDYTFTGDPSLVETERHPGMRWTTMTYLGGNFFIKYDPYLVKFNGFQQVIKEVERGIDETWTPYTTTTYYHQTVGNVDPLGNSASLPAFLDSYGYSHIALSGRPYKTIIEENGVNRVLEDKTWQINALPEDTFSCDGVCLPELVSNQKSVWEDDPALPRTSTVEFEYDDLGNVTKEIYKDRANQELMTKETSYYDSSVFASDSNIRDHPQWQKKSKDGQVYRYKSFVYDSSGNPIQERFHLDDSGSNYHSISRSFYPNGNLQTLTDLDGVHKTISYDTDGLFPTQESILYPSGNALTTTRTFHRMTGEIAQETQSNGVGKIIQYDDFGRPVLEQIVGTTGTQHQTKAYVYNYMTVDLNNQSNVTVLRTKIYEPQPDYPATFAGGAQPAKMAYSDGGGNVLQQCALTERGNYRRVQFRNENGGRLAKQTEPVFASDCSFLPNLNSAARFTVTEKDFQNRPLQVTPPEGDADSPIGNVIYSYATNSSGQYVVTTTHSSGQSKTETFDYNERLISLKRHDDQEITYEYNPIGDLHKAYVDGQLMTEVNYDLLGRKENMTDADMGYWQYFYDASMRLYKQIDNKGQYFINIFDDVGRITRREFYNASANIERYEVYTYDTGDGSHDVIEGELFRVQEYDGANTLLRESRFGQDTEFRRLEKITRTIPGLGDVIQTTTNNYLGQIESSTYPSGETLHLKYNRIRGLTKICSQPDCNTESGEIYYTVDPDTGYNAVGNLLAENYGNGVTTTYDYYSNSHRMRQMTVAKGSEIHSQRQYKFDDRSNITTLDDLLSPTGAGSGNLSNIQYDLNDRLQSYTNPSSASAVTFNHDTKGNLTQNSLSFGTDTYQYGSSRPHAVTQIGSQTFSYDDNGNMTSDSHRQMTYNAQNQLTRVTMTNGTVIDYDYDYAGGRTKKTVTRQDPLGRVITTHTHYLGDALEIRGEKILLHIHTNNKKIITKVLGTVSEIIAAASSSSLSKINLNPEFRFGLVLPYVLLFFTLFLIFSFRPVAVQPAWLVRLKLKARAPPKFLWPIAFPYKIFRSYRKVFQETLFALPRRTALKLTSFALTLLFLLQFPLHAAFANNPDAIIPQSDENYFYYVHGDHLGSTHVLTEGKKEGSKHAGIFYKQGTLLQRMEYAPFGKETFVLNPNLQFEPGYTGQTYDVESGLYYYKSRYYNPELGRFIQPDTLVPDAKNLEAYNRYSYVINNPLKYVDPSGHSFWGWVKKLAGAFIGALVATLIFASLTIPGMNVMDIIGLAMVSGMMGGIVGGAITGGIRGALMGATFGALTGAMLGAAGFGLSQVVGQIGAAAVLAGIGAGLAYAQGGWKGLVVFGAGVVGAYVGKGIGQSIAQNIARHNEYARWFRATMQSDNVYADARSAADPRSRLMMGVEGVGGTSGGGGSLSPYRYTRPGETYQHYGSVENAESLQSGLRPGSYGTTAQGLSGLKAQQGLALPQANPPNAVYTVSPPQGTLIRVNPVIQPQFGQPGGLPEVEFITGTPPGSVSMPGDIP